VRELTAVGVTMLVIFDILILAKGGANGLAWNWSRRRSSDPGVPWAVSFRCRFGAPC
jgi:hypothetical protein